MPEQSVEALVCRTVDAVNRRDLEAFLALMGEDVESVSRIVALEGGLHGHEGVRHWWNNWFGTFPDYTIDVISVRSADDVAVLTIRAVGHSAGGAVPFEDRAWLVSRWTDGKCVRWQVLTDEEAALRLAGLGNP